MIEVVGCRASWPERFAELCDAFTATVTADVTHRVDHVGSTAVPSLAASP